MGFNNASSSTLQAFWQAYDGTGTPVVRLLATVSSPVTTSLQYWTGTAWSTIASAGFTAGVLHQHDVYIKINGASSIITWWVDKVVQITSTADYSSVGNIAQNGFACHQLNGSANYSEVIIHTVNTINRRYNLRLPSANGANTGFTGAYTDVNEAITDNSTFIYAASAALISTFPTAGKDLTGYAVDCVTVNNLSLVDVTGPQHQQWALRIGGVNYFSGVDVAVANGFTSYRAYLGTNPATGLGWLNTEAGDATMEVGLKATA